MPIPRPVVENTPYITVIVPFRNEIDNLPRLIDSLLRLKYPEGKLEILLVDDHSEDNPGEYLGNYLKKYSHIQLLHSDEPGKKAAITLGVKRSNGEWMIVTDADCVVTESWIKGLVRYMSGERHFVFGPIRLNGSGLLSGFQKIEQAALTALGGVSIQSGTPSMANAANMAFRKSTFEELGGYMGNSEVPTGDDEFLLQKIHEQYPDGVVFVKDYKVLVDAAPSRSIIGLINQRRRWASKWGKQAQPLYAIFILVFYVLLIFKTIQVLIDENYAILLLLGIKWLADLVLVLSVQQLLKQRLPVFAFIIGQILYPFYAILIAILANFGSYSWKGRTYRI